MHCKVMLQWQSINTAEDVFLLSSVLNHVWMSQCLFILSFFPILLLLGLGILPVFNFCYLIFYQQISQALCNLQLSSDAYDSCPFMILV